jgi:hypothetical protein
MERIVAHISFPDRASFETPAVSRTRLMVATAVGVVIGAALAVIIVGIASAGYSSLTTMPFPLHREAPEKTPQRYAQVAPAPPVVKEPGMPSAHPAENPAQFSSLKQSPGPAVSAPVAPGKSHITITGGQGSWVDACPDGRTVFRGYLAGQSSEELSFSHYATVRLGSAGGVQASVNGAPVGPLGRVGQIRVVRFDAKGVHFLGPDDPGRECGE